MRPASCEQARKQMKQVGKVEEINRKGKFLLKWMAELRVVDFPINTIWGKMESFLSIVEGKM